MKEKIDEKAWDRQRDKKGKGEKSKEMMGELDGKVGVRGKGVRNVGGGGMSEGKVGGTWKRGDIEGKEEEDIDGRGDIKRRKAPVEMAVIEKKREGKFHWRGGGRKRKEIRIKKKIYKWG